MSRHRIVHVAIICVPRLVCPHRTSLGYVFVYIGTIYHIALTAVAVGCIYKYIKNMKHSKLIVGLTAAGVALSLAAPAFAQTGEREIERDREDRLDTQTMMERRGSSSMMRQSRERRDEDFWRNSNSAPSVVGKVTGIDGSTITVSGQIQGTKRRGMMSATSSASQTSFMVDASVAKIVKANATSTLSGISIGDQVMVFGQISGSSIKASLIRDAMIANPRRPGFSAEDRSQGMMGNGQPVVAGKVSFVNGGTFTLVTAASTTYSVDATNAVFKQGMSTTTIASLSVGDYVVVQGTVNGSSVVATSIMEPARMMESRDEEQQQQQQQPRERGFFSGIGGFFRGIFGF